MTTKPTKRLLIIDDDRFFCQTLIHYLVEDGYDILSVHSKEEGKRITAEQRFGVVLLDQKLPDGNGIDLCRQILTNQEQTKIIFITAFPSFDNAVTALRHGAFDYLSKPLEIEEVAMTIKQAFRTLELERVEQIQDYKNRQEHINHVLIGADNGLHEIDRLVDLAGINDVPVLITGETGVGKNVVAKAIHYRKSSRSSCFMAVNCAALPENLIEAELFGSEKGAFTGATETKKGVFELAEGGTIFLDEIGDLPLHLQAKLLGVLDDKTIKRLGGQTYRQISVRVIAATNIDLESAVKNNRFRRDLYYRLSVLRIHVPPLRNRTQDIDSLCRFFIQNSAHSRNITLPPSEIEALKKYHWPGNVRELKNVIERSLIFHKNDTIFPSDLLSPVAGIESDQAVPEVEIATLAEIERQHITTTLELLDNNHTKTAQALGISRSTLLRKLKDIGPLHATAPK